MPEDEPIKGFGMLNRQKTLLAFLTAVGRPVTRMELTKWAFLLRHETESEGGSAFYEFVPYHFGPFSFSLYQEAGKLVNEGYLTAVDEWTWTLGRTAPPPLDNRQVGADVASIVRRFGETNTDALLEHVYARYPSFTVHSKRKRLAERPTAPIAVYTAGYEGLSVDGFLNRLVEVGIQHLIDVRMNPIARRYGFHKSTLNRLCQNLEIQYSHVPELGIQSSKRQSLDSQNDYDVLFADYNTTTLRTESEAIQRVCDSVRESPSVLVCMEADACRCHRSHLAVVVSQRTELPMHHLQ